MNVEQLISRSVPVLMPEDTGNRALDLMDENNCTQLPVVADDNYVALVRENEVMDWHKPEQPLSQSDLLSYKPAIPALGHPYEALRLMNQMNLSMLPVINFEQKYLGAVTRDTLIKYMAENSGIDGQGGIVVLEVAPRNYTLFEIAKICENEDVTILNVQVYTNDAGMLEVTLKLNRTAINAVISSFERHSYIVKEVYGEERYKEDIASKYNMLMTYINM